jgi:hypothetical protein
VDLHEFRNISVKFLYVYLCLLSRDFFIFSVKVSSFYSYFCVVFIFHYCNIDVNLFFSLSYLSLYVFQDQMMTVAVSCPFLEEFEDILFHNIGVCNIMCIKKKKIHAAVCCYIK